MTKAGKNVSEARGSWEGLLLIPDHLDEPQRAAISEIVHDAFGDGFARLDTRVVPGRLDRAEHHYDVVMADVVSLAVGPLQGAKGEVPLVVNPPSPPMGLARFSCGVAEVHTYDDGAAQWDFAGRNAYYGPFDADALGNAHDEAARRGAATQPAGQATTTRPASPGMLDDAASSRCCRTADEPRAPAN